MSQSNLDTSEQFKRSCEKETLVDSTSIGQTRETIGHALLKALTSNGLIDPDSHRLEDIDACSAECEVNITQEWFDKLTPRSYVEEYVFKRNSRARVLNKHSRLGRQVVRTQKLQGTGYFVIRDPDARSDAIRFPFSIVEKCAVGFHV